MKSKRENMNPPLRCLVVTKHNSGHPRAPHVELSHHELKMRTRFDLHEVSIKELAARNALEEIQVFCKR